MLTPWLPMTSILFGFVRICHSLFKVYLKNEKLFLEFIFLSWNLHQILNIFLKKRILIGKVFLKLETLKDLFRALSKNRCFRTSFESQHLTGSKTLLKSAGERFYHIFSSLCEETISKISPLVKFEILSVFVNTLTADEKYPVQDCENLPFFIQRIS